MVTFRRGFEVVEEKQNFYTPSLKKYLGGWVCYKVVSEHGYNTRPGWAIYQSQG
jgi:hypothetical protein